MRPSLLNFIQCVSCGSELTLLVSGQKEIDREDDSLEIKQGLLNCSKCGHWFPLRDFIPELLPDHLRDWPGDLEFLENIKTTIPGDIFKELSEKSQAFVKQASMIEDTGIHYKKSEISIKTKITDPHFFGPGFTLPFNPGDTGYSMRELGRFGNVLPLLELKGGDVVLDSGPAYAWTTEWLIKMGIEAIGVDICRTYMDIGMQRMEPMIQKGLKPPHLLVGDVENLPIKDRVLDAVLCYDSFHHIPNRKAAMGHFYRTLKESGNIVLAEPDGTHEYREISREAMDKYGHLERGMELEDVNEYCHGLNVISPEQHFILNIQNKEQNQRLSPDFILSHSHIDCNVFVIKKSSGEKPREIPLSKIKRKLKQKVKRLLKWLFIKVFH
ncbi:MAG: methyltransferase domain-containing protein [Candidatus Aminicenantes bacterium]|jgi:uncharacterized protein YbaR (Trm112 family)/SAM-dependent methyltransferase